MATAEAQRSSMSPQPLSPLRAREPRATNRAVSGVSYSAVGSSERIPASLSRVCSEKWLKAGLAALSKRPQAVAICSKSSSSRTENRSSRARGFG
jgi:hypothetical protein